MSAIIISNTAPFGAMSNRAIAGLFSVSEAIVRLQAAISQAAAGFEGAPGTQYETDSNFGVVPDPTQPGARGADFAFAVGNLANEWATFWNAAVASIEALDNGVSSI